MKRWFKTWHLKNIILVTLIGIVCGLIFWLMDPLYSLVTALLTPVGLAPFAGATLLGFWTMAGPLALLVLRRPGAGLLAEFFGAAVEMLLGGIWGAATLVSGLIQGSGSELGFALTGYRRYDWLGTSCSVITTTIVTFGWELIKQDYAGFGFWMLVAMFLVSLLSVFLFSGLLPKSIANLLQRSHLLD
ncbi:ECF transporter S component [Fructilactobacillus florum]|uniref:ECF transporter S component n=1 Tax=Fructilactobacillus florum TaxID=640331 RepID=UPI00028DB74E|nr:ECF transporter S component [Fructilactobacillus florum]EKK21036.1 Substrate-specific component YkoE of thiamin-regulated ECF transporter for HydroxyMethylPyrimidine [Fructilactobacillus florum 2F]